MDNPLLNPDFDPNEIYLYVKDKNRTTQSAYSHLRGLFPFRNQKMSDTQKNNANPPMNVSDLLSVLSFLEVIHYRLIFRLFQFTLLITIIPLP